MRGWQDNAYYGSNDEAHNRATIGLLNRTNYVPPDWLRSELGNLSGEGGAGIALLPLRGGQPCTLELRCCVANLAPYSPPPVSGKPETVKVVLLFCVVFIFEDVLNLKLSKFFLVVFIF